MLRLLPPHVRVTYRGEVPHARVRETFHRYDAFVFPTRGENFGHAVAESLSASCPVLCSAATPWSAVLAAGGGTVVRPLTPAAFGAALAEMAARTPAERHRPRQRAGAAYRAWWVERAALPHLFDQARSALLAGEQGTAGAGASAHH